MVYILSKQGNPLMPTNRHGRVRHLLEDGKAKVVKRTPFTIQLLYDSEEYTQPITLGVDSGYTHIGLSAVTNNNEVFSADVQLRVDMVKVNSDRAQLRSTRRYNKTRYREPRFLNRTKGKGWLAPSIQNKLDTHIKLINMVKSILPITKINIEVANFDIQKIKDPDIEGTDYQNGEQAGFWNTREYVLHRDGHFCQHCKGKSGDKVLEVHHIVTRQTGGNRPDNLITLCSTCHKGVSQDKLKLKIKVSKGFKAESFMSMVRWRLVNIMREMGNNVSHTYGHITKSSRIALGIIKSHVNDAFVIANGTDQVRTNGYLIKQLRKCNRKLHKGIRSHINNALPKVLYGFQKFDRVLWRGIECFIFARAVSGSFRLGRLDGTITTSRSYKQLTLLEHTSTLMIERVNNAVQN